MIAAVHGVVAIVLVLGLHQREWVALGFTALLLSLVWWMRYARREWVLQWDSDNTWQLWRGEQHLQGLRLSTKVVISPSMVSLYLTPVGRILILPDAVGEENHRRLRARLHIMPSLRKQD